MGTALFVAKLRIKALDVALTATTQPESRIKPRRFEIFSKVQVHPVTRPPIFLFAACFIFWALPTAVVAGDIIIGDGFGVGVCRAEKFTSLARNGVPIQDMQVLEQVRQPARDSTAFMSLGTYNVGSRVIDDKTVRSDAGRLTATLTPSSELRHEMAQMAGFVEAAIGHDGACGIFVDRDAVSSFFTGAGFDFAAERANQWGSNLVDFEGAHAIAIVLMGQGPQSEACNTGRTKFEGWAFLKP